MEETRKVDKDYEGKPEPYGAEELADAEAKAFEKELEEALSLPVDSLAEEALPEKVKEEPPLVASDYVGEPERKKKHTLVWVLLFGIGIPVLLLAAFLYYDYTGRVYTRAAVEAGTQIEAMDFAKNPAKEVKFTGSGFLPDTSVPGTYTLALKSWIYTYTCELTVMDTVAPTGTVQNLQVLMGETVSPEAFFVDITDATEVTVSYGTQPDYSLQGEQTVSLVLTDLGGNTTTYEAILATRVTYPEITVEAGSRVPSLEDLLVTDLEDAVLITDEDSIDMNSLVDQTLQVRYDQRITDTILHVVDTTAPTLLTKDVEAFLSSKLSAEDFVDDAKDATALTFSFEKEPDMNLEGEQEITVIATDEGGNTTSATAKAILAADTEAPIFSGVTDISVRIGNKISYRNNVTIRDNCDDDIDFDVDASDVDTSKAGTYVAVYTATDRAGNTVSKEIKVTVTEEVQTHTLEEVNALADKVIANIISEGMTQREMLTAIYNWAHSNIAYIDHSSHDDYLQGAYEGFTLHKGDCFVYASTAKILLDRVGIANRDIRKIPAASNHFWNLVDIGEGWYHFDTTPRKGRPNLCYLNDAQLMEYSNAHNLSHNYDREVYTDIQ